MHVIDARESAPADRGAVAGRDLAYRGGGQRAVEIGRVAGNRARAVRAQVHGGAIAGTALLRVEVIEDAADHFIHRHRQRAVVDGGTAIREIDRGRIARGLIRRGDAVGDARGVVGERDAEAMTSVAANIELRRQPRRKSVIVRAHHAIGILGIFSDWAATVTYYANCMGL